MSTSPAPLLKICGTTSLHDALLAQKAGADFLGIIVEHAPSPRSVSVVQAQQMAAAVSIPVVIVTVNRDCQWLIETAQKLKAHALQLHGDETPELVRQLKVHNLRVWTAISGDNAHQRAQQMRDAGSDALLIDARAKGENGVIYGGTGLRADWNLARELVNSGERVILAGGLEPKNAREAIGFVQPWMVDVVSGVEANKGVKDAEKLREFVSAVREISVVRTSQ